MAYIQLGELRSQLMNSAVSSSQYDGLLQGICDAVERAIDDYCFRSFTVPTEVTHRLYRPTYDGTSLVDLDDIASADDLAIHTDDGTGAYATLVDPADYVLVEDNRTGMVTGIFGTFPRNARRVRTVKVTAMFGWPAVPAAVKQAALLWGVRLFSRKDSASGVVGFGDFGGVRILNMDPDVARLLAPYRDRGRLLA